MEIKVIETPNEKQKLFFLAKERYVAYGGARGGGKSWAVRKKAVLLAIKNAGIRILIIRRSYAELRENHILELQKDLIKVAEYKDTDKAFVFPNGSRIKLGYCDNESDVLRYQGIEFDVIFIDEATQLTEWQFKTLNASIRGANNFPKRMYLTCNPGGIGHTWVKRLFINKLYQNGEVEEEYRFISASVFDNSFLMKHNPEYVKTLESLPSKIRAAWLYGDWDITEGCYFPEFDRNVHVIKAFEIPVDWRRYIALDYGLDKLAVGFFAINESGKVFLYKEIWESDLIVSKAVEIIKQFTLQDEKIYKTIAPPDVWNRNRDTGKSTADIFSDNGIILTQASNRFEDGCFAIKEYLKIYSDEQEQLASDFYVFENCKHFIESISEIMTDERNPNVYAKNPHELTHSVDMFRYFVSARPKAMKNKAMSPKVNFECERVNNKQKIYGKGVKIKII